LLHARATHAPHCVRIHEVRNFIIAILIAVLPATAFAGRHRFDFDAPGSYGAISYSPSTGKIGYSYGYSDGNAAKAAATNACGIGDCTWQIVERDEYAVLATGGGGSAVAWNTDLATAERDALAACNAKGDGCSVGVQVGDVML
jgi:serine/threonine-protein kinase